MVIVYDVYDRLMLFFENIVCCIKFVIVVVDMFDNVLFDE